MAHKGLQQYSGSESGNIALGQLGFEEVTGTNDIGTEGDKTGQPFYCAIKAVLASASGSSTSEISFTAESLQGDDLGTTVLNPGDIIWGCFNYVNITVNTNTYMKLLCYIGK